MKLASSQRRELTHRRVMGKLSGRFIEEQQVGEIQIETLFRRHG